MFFGCCWHLQLTRAYVRFASVYRDFKDLEEFRQEIDRLAKDDVDSSSKGSES